MPLGCCGWWLYALSLLPGIVGTGVSAVLIEYSQVLAYAGLGIIFGFAGLTAYKLKREMKLQKIAYSYFLQSLNFFNNLFFHLDSFFFILPRFFFQKLFIMNTIRIS